MSVTTSRDMKDTKVCFTLFITISGLALSLLRSLDYHVNLIEFLQYTNRSKNNALRLAVRDIDLGSWERQCTN